MLRSLIIGLVISFTLVGCNESPKVSESQTTYDSNPIALAPLGEACGSKIETLCDEGLYCEYDSGQRTGICTQKDVNSNIVCDKEQAPVCGLKNRQKLGYLNECEARRHKATILNEGFCERLDVVDSCSDKVRSVGNCSEAFSGFEHNEAENECAQVPVSGCEAEIPFETMKDCESTCVEA